MMLIALLFCSFRGMVSSLRRLAFGTFSCSSRSTHLSKLTSPSLIDLQYDNEGNSYDISRILIENTTQFNET